MKHILETALVGILVLLFLGATRTNSPNPIVYSCPADQECILEQVVIGGVVKEQRRVLSNGNTVWEALNQRSGQLEPLLWVQHTREVSTGQSTGSLHLGKWTVAHCEPNNTFTSKVGCGFLEFRLGGTPAQPETNAQGCCWIAADKTNSIAIFGGENYYRPGFLTTDLTSPSYPNTSDLVALIDWEGLRLYRQDGTPLLNVNPTETQLRSSLLLVVPDERRALSLKDVSWNDRVSWTVKKNPYRIEAQAYNGLVWQQIP